MDSPNSSFTTIAEYIALAEKQYQSLLKELLALLKKAAPKEAKETINYRMPTLRYNGNLIHFAIYKKHIGLYPGTAAIEHFADDLKTYKTSKGAIQLPLDKPLPKELIQSIVEFNVSLLKDKKSPSWEKHHDKWDECVELMNSLIEKTKTPLLKERKWGADIYTFQGKNVIGWGGFKEFFSLWFYNGVFLEDIEKVLVSASEGKTKALRQWRFTDVKQMDEQKILEYIEESVQTIRDGKEIKIEKGKEQTLDGLLLDFLNENLDIKNAFDSLTPGRRKEYIEFINEAKQDKTKLARIEKITPIILAKRGLHDQYKKA